MHICAVMGELGIKIGLRTQPCGTPVFRIKGGGVLNTHSLLEKKSTVQLQEACNLGDQLK